MWTPLPPSPLFLLYFLLEKFEMNEEHKGIIMCEIGSYCLLKITLESSLLKVCKKRGGDSSVGRVPVEQAQSPGSPPITA